jgi:phosphoglycerol transferase MdoB-like AlkP superfamily enzyme
MLSLKMTGSFISRLAMENIEFIGYMVNLDNSLIILKFIIILIIIPWVISIYLSRWVRIARYIIRIVLLLIVLFLAIIFLVDSKDIVEKKYISDSNSLKHTGMIQAYIEIFEEHSISKNTDLSFITEIKNKYNIDLNIDPFKKYPLEKSYVYKKQIFTKRENKPNIILIFTEGLSARTLSIYNEKFNSLTPHLQNFSEHMSTMTVSNYFNHTAATYKGLHGQLCSLYPKDTGSRTWLKGKLIYTCLPDILSDNGYETTYLNTHYKNSSAIDEIVSRLGFNHVLSGEELSERYMDGLDIRGGYLQDQQFYKMLINYLEKQKVPMQKPFFLAMYTAETHAWTDVDTSKGGMIYKDGSVETLNTIHNMDDAFGKFWEYFKQSKYFKDTLIIFTSDHCHYHDLRYLKLMKASQEMDYDYRKSFIDKIPLLFYSPYNDLPKEFDAHSHTSIDLAPTLLHYLNINDAENSFIGNSLFEPKYDFGFAGPVLIQDGTKYFIQDENHDQDLHRLMIKYRKYTEYLEMNDKLHAKK